MAQVPKTPGIRVYFAPGIPNPHPVGKELLRDPPVPYVSPARWGKERPGFAAGDLFWWAQASAMRLLSMRGLPKMGLVPARGHDLIHACQFLVLNRTPWVLEMSEHVNGFGYTRSFRQLKNPRFIRMIERALSSDRCRKVLPYSQSLVRNMERHLNIDDFRHKIEIVPPAHHALGPIERGARRTVSLLFIGNRFYAKGGRETLEAFTQLRRQVRADLRLTLVSYDIPPDVYREFADDPAVRLLPSGESRLQGARGRFKRATVKLGMPVPFSVPAAAIQELYRMADIFVLPTFVDTIFVYLEAMAHGLPVVTSNVPHGPDLVEDGVTGFIGESPVNWMEWNAQSDWDDTKAFEQLVRGRRFPSVVSFLVESLGRLIEEPGLRHRMGEEGRRRVEDGPFSVGVRNENLRRIYTEAVNG